jgi:hypothetical protein
MIIDETYKSNEDICNEIINSNLSDKAKVKAIQALKGEKEEIKEEKNDEMVLCD